jgi:hypothetical protein
MLCVKDVSFDVHNKGATLIVCMCRVLTCSIEHLRENLVNLQQQLASVGLMPDEIRKLLLKSPPLLLQNRVNLTTKLQALKVQPVEECLGPGLLMSCLSRHFSERREVDEASTSCCYCCYGL